LPFLLSNLLHLESIAMKKQFKTSALGSKVILAAFEMLKENTN
jgi:hypothetical protein